MELISPNFSDVLAPNFELKAFPDGDSYVRILDIEKYKGKDVILFHRLYPNQNESLIQLLFILKLLRDAKCNVTLVSPYLPYSRQDKTFLEGESKSAEVVCEILSEHGVRKLITFDCHFLKKEGEFTYGGLKIRNISLNRALVDKAKEKFKNEHFEVISPDQGASYLVEEFGGQSMKKVRGDYVKGKEAYRKIEKIEGDFDLKGKNVLIIDDMVSTGGTMFKAVENVKKGGAKKVGCATVHGFFLKDSLNKLKAMADFVIATNTIQNDAAEVNFANYLSML
ncbi:MAG: ribose-phosphate diphosphokinase [Candidatus Micrarchaeia archaeon]|jgi:ribose-phosphate pyrophosphokinase